MSIIHSYDERDVDAKNIERQKQSIEVSILSRIIMPDYASKRNSR